MYAMNIHLKTVHSSSRILEMLCEKICRFRRCTGVSLSGAPGIVFSNFCIPYSQSDSQEIKIGKSSTDQFIKHARVEQLLLPSAMPQLLIVIVQTSPVFPEFLKAILVDVVQSAS